MDRARMIRREGGKGSERDGMEREGGGEKEGEEEGRV